MGLDSDYKAVRSGLSGNGIGDEQLQLVDIHESKTGRATTEQHELGDAGHEVEASEAHVHGSH